MEHASLDAHIRKELAKNTPGCGGDLEGPNQMIRIQDELEAYPGLTSGPEKHSLKLFSSLKLLTDVSRL